MNQIKMSESPLGVNVPIAEIPGSFISPYRVYNQCHFVIVAVHPVIKTIRIIIIIISIDVAAL